jgi:hypothetical protein
MELCVRRSKNISELNGSASACTCAADAVDRQTRPRPAPREKPWCEETHYILLWRMARYSRSALVERPVGVHENVFQARARLRRAALRCARRSLAVFVARVIGRNFHGGSSSMSSSSTGSRNFGAISFGSSTWKQHHFIAAEAQRLDGLDDLFRLFVEIRDHEHDAARLQEFLEVDERAWRNRCACRLRPFRWRAACACELALARGGRHVIATSSSNTIRPVASRCCDRHVGERRAR